MSAPGVTGSAPAARPARRVNVGTVVGSAILGGLVGYATNIWIMAVRETGYNDVPSGSAATAPGNILQGSLFWLLAPTVIFAIGGYWRAVGTKRFFFEMRRLPGMLLTLGRSSGRTFQMQFLVGALVGVVASVFIGPSLGLVCSLGFVAALPTAASSVLSSAGYKMTHFVASKLTRPSGSAAPTPEGAGLMRSVVVMFGGAAALLIGFFVTSSTLKWVIAAVLVALVVVQSRRVRSAPPAALLLLLALVGLAIVLMADPAMADDGGWAECVDAGKSWWSCPGSEVVQEWAALGGVLGAVGGAFGAVLGGLIGSWPAGSVFDDPEFLSPGDPGNDLDPTGADEWIRGALDDQSFTDWATTHSPSSPLSPEDFDDYMTWRHEQGLDDPPLPEPEPGVTTTEVVAEPTDKFEGSEGWSGDPEQDEFGDFFTPEVEEEIFGDAALDEIFGPEAPEEEPEGEPEEEAEAPPGSDTDDTGLDEERYVETLDHLSESAFTAGGAVDLVSVQSARDALSLTLGAERVAGESAPLDNPDWREDWQRNLAQDAADAQSPTVWIWEGTRDTAGDLVVPAIRIGSAYLTSGLSEVFVQSFGAMDELLDSHDVVTGLVNAARYLAQNNLPVNTVGELWAGGTDVTWDQWLGAAGNDVLATVGLSRLGSSLGLGETIRSGAKSHFETKMSASEHMANQRLANETGHVTSYRPGNPLNNPNLPGKPVETHVNTVKAGPDQAVWGKDTAGRVPASAPPRPPRNAPPEVKAAFEARRKYWGNEGEAEFNKLRSRDPDYGRSERGMLTYKGQEVTGDNDIKSITDNRGNPVSPEESNRTSQRLGPENRVMHGPANENPALQSPDPAVRAKAIAQANEPGGATFQRRWTPGARMLNRPEE